MNNKLKIYYYVYCASKANMHFGDLIKEINIIAQYDSINTNNYINRQIKLDYISYGITKITHIVENITDPMIRLYWRKRFLNINRY